MLSKRRIKHRGDPVRVPRGPRRGKASGAACLRPRDCPCPLYLYLYIPDLDPIYPIPPINPPPAPFIYRRPPDTTQRPGRHAFYILSRYGGENRLQLRTKDKLLIDRLIGSGIGPNRLRIPPFARRFKTDRPSKPARRTSRRRRPPPCTQMLASLALANICSSRSLR